jgi:hypothetical protein
MTNPAPSSKAPQIVAVLLILHAVVSLGLIAKTYLTISRDIITDNPEFLVRGILIPGIIDISAIAAGLLILKQAPIARGLGRTICIVALVHHVFSFGYAIFIASTRLGVTLPLMFWLLNPTLIVLYVAAFVVLTRWQPPPRESS